MARRRVAWQAVVTLGASLLMAMTQPVPADAPAPAPAWTGPTAAHHLLALASAISEAESHGLDPADYGAASLAAINPLTASPEVDAMARTSFQQLAHDLGQGRVPHPMLVADPDQADALPDPDVLMREALESGDVAGSLAALAPQRSEYATLRAALARYRKIEAAGGWPPVDSGPALQAGDRDPRVAQIRARLLATGDSVNKADEADVFDDDLTGAVQRFQMRVSLEADGVVGGRTLEALNVTAAQRVDQIRVNLERWRWLPRMVEDRRIEVSIAEFRLRALEGETVTRTHDVIVGRPSRPTPIFAALAHRIVLNPWWETPPSLARNDELPLFRRDPDAVQRLGFQVLDASGQQIDPAGIDWQTVPSNPFPYRLRQAPGPLNALGEVKLLLDSPYGVHLHDTPARSLFEQSRRAFSSGCIRVRDPLDLTAWVTSRLPEWTPERLRAAVASGQETPVTLDRPVPVYVLYWTVVPNAHGDVRFVDDLYRRDPGVLAALRGDGSQIDREKRVPSAQPVTECGSMEGGENP